MNEYKEIGMRLKECPEEDVRKARMLVSDFISAAEEVEEVIYAINTYCCSLNMSYAVLVLFVNLNHRPM